MMKNRSSELTPWYKGHNPSRVGVYEVKTIFDEPMYSYWNGSHWFYICPRPRMAFTQLEPSGNQNRIWRGYKKCQN